MEKKRLFFILLALFATTTGAFAGEDWINKVFNMMGSVIAGGIFIMIVLLVLSWIYLPIGIGWMAVSFYKRKSEQSHEDSSLKAIGVALLGGLLGTIFAYIVVGGFGTYASGGTASDLGEGNKYMIKRIIQPVQDRMENSLRGQ